MLVRLELRHLPDVVDTVAVLLLKQAITVHPTHINKVNFVDRAQLCLLQVKDRTISTIAVAQAITI